MATFFVFDSLGRVFRFFWLRRLCKVRVLLTPSSGWEEGARECRHREQAAEETAEPGTDCRTGAQLYDQGTNPERICEDRGVGLSELQRSLKIVRRGKRASVDGGVD